MLLMDSDVMHDSMAGSGQRPHAGLLDSLGLCHPDPSTQPLRKISIPIGGTHRIDHLVGGPFDKTFLGTPRNGRFFDPLVPDTDGCLIF